MPMMLADMGCRETFFKVTSPQAFTFEVFPVVTQPVPAALKHCKTAFL